MARCLGSYSAARSILDAGCGTGGMLPLLQEFGSVEGIDSSSSAVEHCRQRFDNRFQVSVGDLPGALDQISPKEVITAFDVIEHIEDDRGVLEGIHARLTPGGSLVCTVPAYMWLWSRHDELNLHKRRYTARLLRTRLSEAGFTVAYISYFNLLLLAPIAVVRWSARFRKPRLADRTDFERSPSVLNGFLRQVLAAEAGILRSARLPAGVSLIAVARKAAF